MQFSKIQALYADNHLDGYGQFDCECAQFAKNNLGCGMNHYFACCYVISFVSLLSGNALAETLYMPDNCNNLQACISQMSGGDTLIVRDGSYTGKENTIYSWEYPPNGTSSAYTKIVAEHLGRAIFDGQATRPLIEINGNGMSTKPSYLQFEGLVFRNSLGNGVSIASANHIKFVGCGFFDAIGANENSASPLFFRYVDYALIEDSYTFGNGAYKYYILDSNHIILRRCVDRFDRGISSSGYHSSFRIYSSNYVELQNCISIDANKDFSLVRQNDGSVIASTAHCAIWSGGVNGPNNDVHIRGSMILNNAGARAYILQNSYSPQNNSIEDSVFWDIKDGLWTRLEVAEGTTFRHLTIGKSVGGGISGEYGYGAVAKNNIIYNATAYGLSWVDNPSNSSDYNALYLNGDNYGNGASPKSHDFSSENGNALNPLSHSLKYLTKIENNSDLSGKASDGGDIGATILKKIGRSGTLWGDDGYAEVTNDNLWPWPNEDIIKQWMSSYSYQGSDSGLPSVSGARGFAASGTGLYGGPITLTSYIWEYLGQPCPTDICDLSDHHKLVAPNAPLSLRITQ